MPSRLSADALGEQYTKQIARLSSETQTRSAQSKVGNFGMGSILKGGGTSQRIIATHATVHDWWRAD